MIPGMNGSLNSGGQAALPRAPAQPRVVNAGPPIYTNYNRSNPQQTHIMNPGGRTSGNVPGAGASGATQARQDAAAAAAYARQIAAAAAASCRACVAPEAPAPGTLPEVLPPG